MRTAFRVTAIIALLATIAAAGVVLYGVNTLVPVVESAALTVMPAAQQQALFDDIMEKLAEDTFAGKIFTEEKDFSAEDCVFVTATVRLTSGGFFPAEWVTMSMQPQAGDILLLPDSKGYVLPARSSGDIACVFMTKDSAPKQRQVSVNFYILGREFTLDAIAN